MIITRSPLRITLGGGGTDLPSYYREHEGFLIAAAIDQYVYISLQETFQKELILKYSQLERPASIEDIKHPILREAIRFVQLEHHYMEISSMADIPSGTGLGSSGSFTSALLAALHLYKGDLINPEQIAREACHIEIDLLKEPIGKQDQYIAAYGGITCFYFRKDDSVEAVPLHIAPETLYNLEDNLIFFYTGFTHSASDMLRGQNERLKRKDDDITKNLHFVKELGQCSKIALERGDLEEFGKLLDVHWLHKKARAGDTSNPHIDECYTLAMQHGALGGKLIGAGGGGFLMFYCANKMNVRAALTGKGLREVRVRLGAAGTKAVTT